MIKVNRILCPTDLSTESDAALRYAVALARAYEAKLFLLIGKLLGSNVDRVLREAPCPVLVAGYRNRYLNQQN